MTRTLEEIIEALEPQTVREALQSKRADVKRMIANMFLNLQFDETNPTLTSKQRDEGREQMGAQIIWLDDVLSSIDERLTDSDFALKGMAPTRAQKRRAARNGA